MGRDERNEEGWRDQERGRSGSERDRWHQGDWSGREEGRGGREDFGRSQGQGRQGWGSERDREYGREEERWGRERPGERGFGPGGYEQGGYGQRGGFGGYGQGMPGWSSSGYGGFEHSGWGQGQSQGRGMGSGMNQQESGGRWGQGQGRGMGYRGRGPRNYRRSDERIREDINDQLTMSDEVDGELIEVTVSNCEITLSGFVPDREQKRRAEDIAEQVAGVREVHNQLRVGRGESQDQLGQHGLGAGQSTSEAQAAGSEGRTRTGQKMGGA